MTKPLILISNDDSVDAPGIQVLTKIAQSFGDVVVAAPASPQSGMSHALTSNTPLRVHTIKESTELSIYACGGTPADCIKLAMNSLVPRKPDLVVSGINHGSNSSISVVYSGTMAAAAEGAFYKIPSIGFSLCNHSIDADFSPCIPYINNIVDYVLKKGLSEGIALNVNFPDMPEDQIKGIKICRQNKGWWNEEFDKRKDPLGREYYWLMGNYINLEPEAEDTDEAALANGYVSIVPTHFDLTAYNQLDKLKDFFE